MTDELKPVRCGCGGEAIIGLKEWEDRKGNYHENSFVYCDDCSISTGGYLTEAEAVTAWNRAMSGNMQECAENARCTERTAKAEWSEVDGCHLCGECGFAVCPNCDVYCAGCGARLEWE